MRRLYEMNCHPVIYNFVCNDFSTFVEPDVVCIIFYRFFPPFIIFLIKLFKELSRSFFFQIDWHTIFWSVALQFLCAMFVLKFKYGKDTIMWMQDRFTEFFENTYEGGLVMFGPSWKDHMFIFGVRKLQ